MTIEDTIDFSDYKYLTHKLRLLLLIIGLYFTLFFVLYSLTQFKMHDQTIVLSSDIQDHTTYVLDGQKYLIIKSCLWWPQNFNSNLTCPDSYELIATSDMCTSSNTTPATVCIMSNITQHYANTFYPNCNSVTALYDLTQTQDNNDYIALNAKPNVYIACGVIIMITIIALIILSYMLTTQHATRHTNQDQINYTTNKIALTLTMTIAYFVLLIFTGPIFSLTSTTTLSIAHTIELNCSSIDFYPSYLNFLQKMLINAYLHLDLNQMHQALWFVMYLAYLILSSLIVIYMTKSLVAIKK